MVFVFFICMQQNQTFSRHGPNLILLHDFVACKKNRHTSVMSDQQLCYLLIGKYNSACYSYMQNFNILASLGSSAGRVESH